MDRRRLEAAHLRFAVLNVDIQFKLDIDIHPDNHITLPDITPKFYAVFRSAYASKFKVHVYMDFSMHGILWRHM